MGFVFRPSGAADLAQLVADANGRGGRLELRGGGSKAAYGGWAGDADVVDMGGLSGVIDYDPPELVLTAWAGTPVAEVEALLAVQGQMLAFEPMDHGPLLGGAPGRATLGGLVGAASCGPRRLSAGALRDHLLGFEAVTGGGEAFKAGGKVVKNVTGFDLSKLMAGSWGGLAALTQVTFKVLPAPRESATLALGGLGEAEAVSAMTLALRAPAEVSGAAHLPAWATDGEALTILRLEGFGPSIRARVELLRTVLGRGEVIEGEALWTDVRDASRHRGDHPVWRVTCPPAIGGALAEALAAIGARCTLDWGGGLIWASLPDGDAKAAQVHAVAAGHDGHATLVRGPAATDAFPSQPPALAALSARVKAAFDPRGVLVDRRNTA